jgi:hypothetical protein
LSLPHQRGKIQKTKTKQNKTKQNNPSSNAVEFQLVLQHAVPVQMLSHQRKRKKK